MKKEEKAAEFLLLRNIDEQVLQMMIVQRKCMSRNSSRVLYPSQIPFDSDIRGIDL